MSRIALYSPAAERKFSRKRFCKILYKRTNQDYDRRAFEHQYWKGTGIGADVRAASDPLRLYRGRGCSGKKTVAGSSIALLLLTISKS